MLISCLFFSHLTRQSKTDLSKTKTRKILHTVVFRAETKFNLIIKPDKGPYQLRYQKPRQKLDKKLLEIFQKYV